MAQALIYHVSMNQQESKRPWLPATHFRYLTALDGAFSKLGVYVTNFEGGIRLSESPEWRNALKTWSRTSVEHQPINQVAATAEDILLAVHLNQDPQIRAFMILMWLLAARRGDVMKLRSANVSLLPEGQLKVLVQHGKGVLFRQGAYHIISHVPPVWFQEISLFLESRKDHLLLFDQSLATSTDIINALRVANPQLSCRAIRRGSAIAMAKDQNVSEETIMMLTGHKNQNTLRRYLDWGNFSAKNHKASQKAAKDNLAPSTTALFNL